MDVNKIQEELKLKKDFLDKFADVEKYRLNISKILDELGLSWQKFEYWISKKEFLQEFSYAKKKAADNLFSFYVSLFIDYKDRLAGEALLKYLDPERFDLERDANKDSIQTLIIDITRDETPGPKTAKRKSKSSNEKQDEDLDDNS